MRQSRQSRNVNWIAVHQPNKIAADEPRPGYRLQEDRSSAAGELSATKSAIVEVEKRSGDAFVRNRDEVASALRDLATELCRKRDDLAKPSRRRYANH